MSKKGRCVVKRTMSFMVYDGDNVELKDFCGEYAKVTTEGNVVIHDNDWTPAVCNIDDYIVTGEYGFEVMDEACFLKYYIEVD